MAVVRSPRSLRGESALARASAGAERSLGSGLALACIAVGGGAEAQTPAALPTLTVDAPVVRKRPVAAPKPSAPQARARAAIRQRAREARPAPAQPVAPPPSLPTFARAPGDNPYAQAGSPYKVNRVQSSKFSEPIANTARTITVLTKEVLEDKGATSLRELGRSTAGVTLGTGEGGNAFGDRFFIRGFDARNDIFIDGIRDPSVSVRENFFTEQVEILRGPASSFAGRGTAGGAINIVTKKATADGDFRTIETTGSPTDRGGRVTLDVNQVVNPTLAVRVNGLFQDQKVPGRDFVTDHRAGAALSVVFKPVEPLKLTFDYVHTDLNGLPDFGVPYFRATNRPFTEGFSNRNTWYGFAYRDFQHVRQDSGTVGAEYRVNDAITLSSKVRRAQTLLAYVGTLAEAPTLAGQPWPGGRVNLNPQSRYQTTAVLASQSDATIKYDTGPIRNTSVIGAEVSHEQILRDSYRGLSSESTTGTPFTGTGGTTGSLLFPPNLLGGFANPPPRAGNPTNIAVDTKSAYLIHTANYNDFIILNGGVRFDDYRISSYAPVVATIGWLQPAGVPAQNPYQAYAANHSALVNTNAGLVIKPLPWWSLYGAYATSANPVGAELDGTTAQYGGLNAAAQILAPERNTSIEAGSKFELLDRRLLLTAALFQIEKTNAREIVGGGVVANAAYRIHGVDLGVAGKITDRWSVTGGLVLMQSKVTKSQFPTNVGLPLANVAHASFSLLSKYQMTPEWEIGGQAVFNSRRYGGTFLAANGGTAFNAQGLPAPTAANPFVNVPTVLPSYWRFDAFTEYKITSNVTAKVQAINVFNRTYYDAFYQSAAPFAQVAPGRSVQFSVKANF